MLWVSFADLLQASWSKSFKGRKPWRLNLEADKNWGDSKKSILNSLQMAAASHLLSVTMQDLTIRIELFYTSEDGFQ